MENVSAIITPEFRVSYAHIFKPEPPQPGDDPNKKPSYTLTMLFALAKDISAMKAAAIAAAKEYCGDRLNDPLFAAKMRSPFRDQGEKLGRPGKKDPEGYVRGAIFVKATALRRPGLVDHNVQAIIEEHLFYSGCYAIASVNFFGYGKLPQHKGNWGISCGLNNIQKIRDGDPLGGRTRPEDDFKPAAPAAGVAPAGKDAPGLFS